MLHLFVALKIPIAAAIYIVWWAIKQEPDPSEDAPDDGGSKTRLHPIPHRGPKPPRRDPHGAPEPPSPPRVRTPRDWTDLAGARSPRAARSSLAS